MNVYELVTYYPQLYHMANEGSWTNIRQHGLLTTRQLTDQCDLSPDVRAQILDVRRPRSIVVTHPNMGLITIRDQAPLREQFLQNSLVDMTMRQWLDVLNSRVFFWLHERKLLKLLNALRYRTQAHDVLTIDTAKLVHAYGQVVRLSAVNSGATLYPNASPRGRETFVAIEDYPFAARRKRHSLDEAIVELAVVDGVPDIKNYVLRAERRRRDQTEEVLYDSGTY